MTVWCVHGFRFSLFTGGLGRLWGRSLLLFHLGDLLGDAFGVTWAVEQALSAAGITASEIGTVETRDCFTIAGVMATEAIGLAASGEGPDFITAGHTARDGRVPFNTTGGLIGWGHPTGATGVHQAVTIWEQLTGRAEKNQIAVLPARPYGLSVNMGGDDNTLVAIVYRRGA